MADRWYAGRESRGHERILLAVVDELKEFQAWKYLLKVLGLRFWILYGIYWSTWLDRMTLVWNSSVVNVNKPARWRLSAMPVHWSPRRWKRKWTLWQKNGTAIQPGFLQKERCKNPLKEFCEPLGNRKGTLVSNKKVSQWSKRRTNMIPIWQS